MKFEEALAGLRAGKSIKRMEWIDRTIKKSVGYERLSRTPKEVKFALFESIRVIHGATEGDLWACQPRDILANDWYIIP